MRCHLFILLSITALVGCATQSGVSGGVKNSATVIQPLHPGVVHSREYSGSSQGFVSGDGTIQRSTRVPGGYPHYHRGYPARGNFHHQQHGHSEYYLRPRSRIQQHRGDVQIQGEW